MIKSALTLIAALLLGACASVHAAQDSERASLRGLGTIKVLVEPLSPDVKDDGLSEQRLQTDAELRLRRAGIVVVDPDSVMVPFLYVVLTAPKGTDEYGYSLEVSLNQRVILPRSARSCLHGMIPNFVWYADLHSWSRSFGDTLPTTDTTLKHVAGTLEAEIDNCLDFGGEYLSCPTWRRGTTGFCHQSRLESVIRESVADLVDRFINDYLAVNPPVQHPSTESAQ